MKIAILQTPTTSLNLNICGGLERTELYELELLNKLGHKVDLYAANIISDNPILNNIHEIRDINWKNRFLKFIYYFNFYIQAKSCDIFHGHYVPILNLLFPEKSVVHFHGLAVNELILYNYFRHRYHNAHYIFCSSHIKESFVELYPDIPSSHLHVLYNGVDVNHFFPAPKKEIAKSNNKVHIGFYGRWVVRKGLFDILEAARILKQKRDDFIIHLAGSTDIPVPYKIIDGLTPYQFNKKVEEYSRKLKCIELPGAIPHDKLPNWLQQLDIGLAPTRNPEPFGIVNVEIMASGLPVIATRVGGIPEIVVDGETGILIEPNNPEDLAAAIEKLLDNPDLRSKMGEAARKHVEKNFTWEKHVNQLLSIYQKILDC